MADIFRGLQESVAYVRTEPFFKYTAIFFFFTCFAGTFVSSNLVHYLKQQGISEEYLGYY